MRRGRAAVAAAAQLFHQDLHVDLADRTGGGIDVALAVGRDDDRRLDAGDVQQLVRGLGGHDAVLRLLGRGDGDVSVKLGVLHDAVARDRILHVVLQQAFDIGRVGAAAAQIGRRVKGALAGADRKALGVEHDAGEQRLGLALDDVARLGDLLQHLGDQLAGRGGVRLDKREGGVLDIGRGDAVVVDDGDAVAGREQVGVLHPLGAVDVDDDQKRPPVGAQHRLGLAHEDIFVFRLLAQHGDQTLRRVLFEIRDDVHADAEFARQAAHADGGADRVEIREAVAHDDHARRVAHKLGQRGGHDAGFDLGPPLDLAAAAAVKVEVQTVFDDGLVAAARESQLGRHLGELHRLLQRLAVHAETQGERGVDARGADDLVYLLDDGEFSFLERVEIAPLEHEDIAVAVIAPQDRLALVRPLGQLVVDRVAQVVLDALGLVLRQLVEIVDHDHAGDRAAVFKFDADAVILGDVDPIGDAHEGALLVGVLRTDDVAVELVLLSVDLQQTGILGLALEQPFARKARHGVGNARVKARARFAAHVEEHLVAPDDARVGQMEDRDRQREIHQRVVLGVFRVIGHRFDIRGQLLFAAAAHDDGIDDQQQDGSAFGHREGKHIQIIDLEEKSRRREKHEKDQIQSRARLGKALEGVVHGDPSFAFSSVWEKSCRELLLI